MYFDVKAANEGTTKFIKRKANNKCGLITNMSIDLLCCLYLKQINLPQRKTECTKQIWMTDKKK